MGKPPERKVIHVFSKTETARRLRVIAAEGKRLNGIPTYSKAEVGLRIKQQWAATAAEAIDLAFVPDDDLSDFTNLDGVEEDLRTPGAVVHVYLYTRNSPSDEWDLYSVVVGWLGTPDREPVMLWVDGTRVAMNLHGTDEVLPLSGTVTIDLADTDPRCPACGEFIDYCQGHGEIGDPWGFATLTAHDAGDHESCDPRACMK